MGTNSRLVVHVWNNVEHFPSGVSVSSIIGGSDSQSGIWTPIPIVPHHWDAAKERVKKRRKLVAVPTNGSPLALSVYGSPRKRFVPPPSMAMSRLVVGRMLAKLFSLTIFAALREYALVFQSALQDPSSFSGPFHLKHLHAHTWHHQICSKREDCMARGQKGLNIFWSFFQLDPRQYWKVMAWRVPKYSLDNSIHDFSAYLLQYYFPVYSSSSEVGKAIKWQQKKTFYSRTSFHFMVVIK